MYYHLYLLSDLQDNVEGDKLSQPSGNYPDLLSKILRSIALSLKVLFNFFSFHIDMIIDLQ